MTKSITASGIRTHDYSQSLFFFIFLPAWYPHAGISVYSCALSYLEIALALPASKPKREGLQLAGLMDRRFADRAIGGSQSMLSFLSFYVYQQCIPNIPKTRCLTMGRLRHGFMIVIHRRTEWSVKNWIDWGNKFPPFTIVSCVNV